MSRLSTQYVQVPVEAIISGAAYNPTGDIVRMAFMSGWALPEDSDWLAASWSDSTAPGIYLAQCLVGPQNGGKDLGPGTYAIWVQITDSPEIPVFTPGSLVIT
jgi:hypothetical protein